MIKDRVLQAQGILSGVAVTCLSVSSLDKLQSISSHHLCGLWSTCIGGRELKTPNAWVPPHDSVPASWGRTEEHAALS